jgi:hypothetical protein
MEIFHKRAGQEHNVLGVRLVRLLQISLCAFVLALGLGFFGLDAQTTIASENANPELTNKALQKWPLSSIVDTRLRGVLGPPQP